MGTAAAAGASSPPPSPLITAKSPPDAIAALAAGLVPTWSALPPSSLEVRVISGGITNALWAVSVKESASGEFSPRAVAVRAYGDRTDLLIDRAVEVEALARLNAAGFGARVLACFDGGRVEEFLPGRALTPEETAEARTAERVARGLARLHAADVEDLGSGRRRRKKTSCCLSFFFSPLRPGKAMQYSEEDSALFSTIREWVALADRLDAEGGAGEEGKEAAATKTDKNASPSPSVGSAELLAEVALLEERVKACCSPSNTKNAEASSCPELSRVVFCHMDLLPGNIMTTEDDSEGGEKEADEIPSTSSSSSGGPGRGLQFIDFEYGRPCQAGFDVGNHWCEYAGLDCDWSRYPTAEQRRAFARAYLSEADECSPSSRKKNASPSRPPQPPSEERVAAFVAQAELFSLAAHLFWTAWARVQVHVSPIDFDYAAYARSRFEDFGRRRKKEEGVRAR